MKALTPEQLPLVTRSVGSSMEVCSLALVKVLQELYGRASTTHLESLVFTTLYDRLHPRKRKQPSSSTDLHDDDNNASASAAAEPAAPLADSEALDLDF